MAVTTRGTTWTGTESADIDAYLRAFAAGGYPVKEVVHAVCAQCASAGTPGQGFCVEVDQEEGVAVRQCIGCGSHVPMLDSADHLDDAEIATAACPCGREEFDVAVGFALFEDGDVRWVSVGMRCRHDGLLGVYVHWKIDYSPSRQLLVAV